MLLDMTKYKSSVMAEVMTQGISFTRKMTCHYRCQLDMYDGMSDLMAVFCLFAGMSFDMPLGTLRFTGSSKSFSTIIVIWRLILYVFLLEDRWILLLGSKRDDKKIGNYRFSPNCGHFCWKMSFDNDCSILYGNLWLFCA